VLDQPRVPLHRDLTEPVEDTGLAVEIVTEAAAAERVAVQRASFDTSTFTVERWHAMAAARPYDLLGRDRAGRAAVAALRAVGASGATVYTPPSNTGAVATYRAAGQQP
jgi:uncharacterized protein